jgi:hypothetical protein
MKDNYKKLNVRIPWLSDQAKIKQKCIIFQHFNLRNYNFVCIFNCSFCLNVYFVISEQFCRHYYF